MVAQWLVMLPYSNRVLSSILLSMWSLHVLPVFGSSVLQQSKDMQSVGVVILNVA